MGAGELSQVLDFMIVNVADHDGVDFDRSKTQLLRQPDGAQDFLQTVAPRHLFEVSAVE